LIYQGGMMKLIIARYDWSSNNVNGQRNIKTVSSITYL